MSCAGGGCEGLPGIHLQAGASNCAVVMEFCSLLSSLHRPSTGTTAPRMWRFPEVSGCPAPSLLCPGVLAKAGAPWAAHLLPGACLENVLMRISPQSCSANERVPEALEWFVPAQNPQREPDLGAFLSPCDSELA